MSDELSESLMSDNVPIFTEQEKYNQCVISVVDRVSAQLKGEPVPGAGCAWIGHGASTAALTDQKAYRIDKV